MNNQEVCCHYYEKPLLAIQGDQHGFVLLMRETINANERLEDAVHRGVMEEFGMKVHIRGYLGSLISEFKLRQSDVSVQKTTLYFLCDLISLDETLRDHEDNEGKSEIRWFSPEELVPKMKEQGQKLNGTDVDESSIIERALAMRATFGHKTPPIATA